MDYKSPDCLASQRGERLQLMQNCCPLAAPPASEAPPAAVNPRLGTLQTLPLDLGIMAAITQCPRSATLRPGHRRGGAAAAKLRKPLAARAPAAVQGGRRALVVLAATHKASAVARGVPAGLSPCRASRAFWNLLSALECAACAHSAAAPGRGARGWRSPPLPLTAAGAPILLAGDLQDAQWRGADDRCAG